ncbi:hypothetical protein BDZ89DRAFT_953183 [Hymenopellis radicata]|nr:hypothetical protein BDZ89DRAFT_953183 [Hymenopellis radicata]
MDPCTGQVPPDSDISGIGVRVAVYVQNLLSFVPAIWALKDGTVTESELASVETQATTILITAFAILISAMVEAKTLGLNTFNANIVLDLSWMNNTNVFIYFILYIQHKSERKNGNVASSWRAWIRHVRESFGPAPSKAGKWRVLVLDSAANK